MRVDSLQRFIRSLGDLLSPGAKILTEMNKLCLALEPFKEQDIGKVADFLKGVADEYVKTGMIGLPAAKVAKPPKVSKPKKKGIGDVDAVQDSATKLKVLYDRAIDPQLDPATIKAEVDGIAEEFDADGLIAVAKACGIIERVKTKKDAHTKILKRITERKSSYERTQGIVQPER